MSDLDYEAATPAIRERMLRVAVASLVVSAVVGGLQCFLIWRGLGFLSRDPDTRDRAPENRRHAERMAALAEQRATLTEATGALGVVVERAAPQTAQ